MDSFKLLLILVLLLLIWIWAEESKWMEENWPEIEMDFFWDGDSIEFE